MEVILMEQDDKVEWEELVGKDSKVGDTTFSVIRYDGESNLLDIAEFNPEHEVVTNQIALNDTRRAVILLKQFGFIVKIIKKFSFTENTITRLNGFILAGYPTIKLTRDIFRIGNIINVDFFTEEEVKHLRQVMIPEKEYQISEILNL